MGSSVTMLVFATHLAVEFFSSSGAIFPGQTGDILLVNGSALSSKDLQKRSTESDIQFLLFTKVNRVLPTLLKTGDTSTLGHFDPSFPTVMVIHGFQSNQRTMMPIAEAYLGLEEKVNVIVLNWTVLSSTDILHAFENVELVASATTRLIHFLVIQGLDTRALTLVGFSLGAHVAGLAAYRVNSISVGRIVGLDPAGVIYYLKNGMKKLDHSDADFVQVVHTAANTVGYNGNLGHVDFYFNGGTEPQPGCKHFTACSHLRATEYYAESIKGIVPFVATQCSDYQRYKSGKCLFNRRTIFSPQTPVSVRGKFFLTTNEIPPYAQG